MHKILLTPFSNSSSDNLKSKIENRKWAGLFAIVLALTLVGARAERQQPAKVPRIGYLTAASLFRDGGTVPTRSARVYAISATSRGKTLSSNLRSSEGKPDRLPALVAELVRLKVDVIVTGGGDGVTRLVKEATSTIAIVMAQDSDPVGNGFSRQPCASGREHHWIVHPLPGVKRQTTGASPGDKLPSSRAWPSSELQPRPGNAQELREMELAAGALEVKLQYLDVLDSKDIETAFRAASKGRADAVLMLAGPVVTFSPNSRLQSSR